MKKFLFIILIALNLCHSKDIQNYQKYKPVAFIRLISNPNKLDNNHIYISGFVKRDFESAVLYFSKESYEQGDRSQAIELILEKEHIINNNEKINVTFVTLKGKFVAKTIGRCFLCAGRLESVTLISYYDDKNEIILK
jgi:hypothetical protein